MTQRNEQSKVNDHKKSQKHTKKCFKLQSEKSVAFIRTSDSEEASKKLSLNSIQQVFARKNIQ